MVAETFSLSSLKKTFPVFQAKSRNLANLFGENLDQNGKGVVDVVDCYNRLGMDVAGFAIMGVELNNLTSSDPNPEWK